MGAHRSRNSFFARLLPAAGGILALALTAGCGGGAPNPTPTTAVAASPAPATPQRPALLSPVPSPSATTAAAGPNPTAAASAGPAAAGQTYTVQAGDTLGKIADHFYGDSTQWRRIYDANKDAIGDNPDALKLDMQLTIPPAPPTPTPGG